MLPQCLVHPGENGRQVLAALPAPGRIIPKGLQGDLAEAAEVNFNGLVKMFAPLPGKLNSVRPWKPSRSANTPDRPGTWPVDGDAPSQSPRLDGGPVA